MNKNIDGNSAESPPIILAQKVGFTTKHAGEIRKRSGSLRKMLVQYGILQNSTREHYGIRRVNYGKRAGESDHQDRVPHA